MGFNVCNHSSPIDVLGNTSPAIIPHAEIFTLDTVRSSELPTMKPGERSVTDQMTYP